MTCISLSCHILREWKQIQDQYKEYLGQDFYDYNLVLTLPNGRPVENRIMEKEFSNPCRPTVAVLPLIRGQVPAQSRGGNHHLQYPRLKTARESRTALCCIPLPAPLKHDLQAEAQSRRLKGDSGRYMKTLDFSMLSFFAPTRNSKSEDSIF